MTDLLRSPGGRRLLFAVLYLSEGAPIGFIWWALPARLRVAGVPIEEIASLSALLILPWTLKFLWAPLIDTLRSPRWTLRSWIFTAQTVMGLSLVPLLILDLHSDFDLVIGLLFVHAVAAATQDVSVDALAIASVSGEEKGSVNGWMQAGMLLGRSALGGGALLLASAFGDMAVVSLLIGIIWFSMGFLFLSRADVVATIQREQWERLKDVAARLKTILRCRSTWLALVFALIGGAGFEAVGAVVTPFLIDMGISIEETGWFMAFPVVLAMMIGAVAGGYLSDLMGRIRSVRLFLLLIAVLILSISVTIESTGNGNTTMLFMLLGALYLGIGFFTASSYALFMDMTDVHLGATQFSAYMGVTNACEMWSALAVGQLVGGFGYAIAFAVMAAVSFAALPVLKRLSNSSKELLR